MTSRSRLLTALEGGRPDRLPATTHHLMPYFLDRYLGGQSVDEFFDVFDLDAIRWLGPVRPDETRGERIEPAGADADEARHVVSDHWRIERETTTSAEGRTVRYRFVTPKGTLTTVMRYDAYTSWSLEPVIKSKTDIELLAEFAPRPLCDVEQVNAAAEDFGERGIVRGHVPGFEVFGQPGVWQDAACLFGIQPLIMATFDDPEWVHALLGILRDRKAAFVRSMAGAAYDLVELGGGDASSTVISPKLFDAFVAPYDAALIDTAHEAGQRIVYHTCGGMMPLLERIAGMGPDAMETFTPSGMGGDVDLAAARRRIPADICMIGGFDQIGYFVGCSADRTRDEVRRCFEAAGRAGGYIISPSDHFYDAEPALIAAYAEAARGCTY